MNTNQNRKRAEFRLTMALLLFPAAVSGMLASAFLSGCGTSDAKDKRTAQQTPVERGKYLVTIGGCNDCHTPFAMGPNGPEPDMKRMLSGHPKELVLKQAPRLPEGPWVWTGAGSNTAFAGPWGISFSANLTPDPSTGLVLDEAGFMRALRTGKHLGAGRDILPPMPWLAVGQMTDDDLKSVYAYLRTIPPVENEVPTPVPPTAMYAGR